MSKIGSTLKEQNCYSDTITIASNNNTRYNAHSIDAKILSKETQRHNNNKISAENESELGCNEIDLNEGVSTNNSKNLDLMPEEMQLFQIIQEQKLHNKEKELERMRY